MKRQSRPEPAAAAEAARLGEELRDARMAMGLSVEDVAAALRIRRVYLLALEEGRARDLPAPAYAVGFVRSYARALGLDHDEIVRRFREGASTAVPRKTDLVFPEPVPERGVPAGALVLAGAVVVIGAYVGWWHWSGSGERVVDTVPPPSPRVEELAATRAPPPPPRPPVAPGESAATRQAAPAAEGPAQRPSAPAPSVAPSPSPTPTAAIAAPAPPLPPVPVAAPAPAPAASPPAAAPRPAEPRLLLRARTADVWIQVRERPNGPVLVDRVLRPGDSWQAPAQEGMVLATGNAGGLEVVVDGEPLGLGPGQSVRRGIPLDVERLKALAAPARPAPQ